MTDLSPLLDPRARSYGYGINNAGQVVGWADTSTGAHAILYSNGQMSDLGALPGSSTSFGQDINDAG